VAVNPRTELTVSPWSPATSPATDDPSAITYLMHEFQRLRSTISDLAVAANQATDAAPLSPRNGMIRYAEGAWGTALGGNGLYVYKAGAWTKLLVGGDYVASNIPIASAVALATGVVSNVTSISLAAGDWDVSGNVAFNPAAGTTATVYAGGISLTFATAPTLSDTAAIAQQVGSFAGPTGFLLPTGICRLSLAVTTTVYLIASATFAGGTDKAYGYIRARRLKF
jgi:hypothetical protein